MAHKEQMAFVEWVSLEHPDYFTGKRVLEIGSLNVNGTVRTFFQDCDYVGIDCHDGRGVDVVTLAHEYDPDEPFDVVISCEAFEHDPYLEQTLQMAMRLLRSGGLFVATCAGPNRPEHGTKATGHKIWSPDPDHYRNVGAFELFGWLRDDLDPLETKSARNNQDVYCWGKRK